MITTITAVTGRAVPLRGSDMDTDRIIPARYLRCVTFDGLGEHAFEDDRRQDAKHPFNQERYQGASILFAGLNFGCGSSREHAPQSLRRWGIQAIVAESFAEIFFGNCLANGIPCITAAAADLETLFAAAEADPDIGFTVDVAAATVTWPGGCVQGRIPSGARDALLSGDWDATSVLARAGERIDATAAALPYMHGFA